MKGPSEEGRGSSHESEAEHPVPGGGEHLARGPRLRILAGHPVEDEPGAAIAGTRDVEGEGAADIDDGTFLVTGLVHGAGHPAGVVAGGPEVAFRVPPDADAMDGCRRWLFNLLPACGHGRLLV